MRSIRLATKEDLPALLAVYAPYVEKSTATLEYDVPDLAEFTRRFEEFTADFPWLVCEIDGKIMGYAYAHKFHPRAGYAWSAESTVYVAEDSRQGGVGRQLYNVLIPLLRAQGYRRLFALVTRPNPASERFHLSMGFSEQGLWDDAAYKYGRPVSVSYYGLELLPTVENPPLPTPFPQMGEDALRDVLATLPQ